MGSTDLKDLHVYETGLGNRSQCANAVFVIKGLHRVEVSKPTHGLSCGASLAPVRARVADVPTAPGGEDTSKITC